jgi:S-DNA-T family DNA segregation ATPase FtsK/SpoIIIE
VRRPWLEPLPARLPLAGLLPEAAPGRVVLGRLDLPAEQRQPLAEWDAGREPRLLVAGRNGTGRTSLLAVVAAQLGCAVAPDDPAAVWDRLHDDGAPLLLDDTEAVLDRLGAHADAAVDRLLVRLRARDAAPTVLCCRGPGAWAGARMRALAGFADRTLLLGLDLDDHLALGGARSLWAERARPGRALWDGAVVQLALPAAPAPRVEVRPAPLLDLRSGSWLVATAAPAERLAQLRTAGVDAAAPGDGRPASVLVASPAGWQADWALLGRLLPQAPVLVDRIPPADARALTGRAAVLPPVTAPDEVVLVPVEGQPERRRLPL